MAPGCALGTRNRDCIYVFVYQCIPQGRAVFLFLESQPVPQSLANSFFLEKILVPPHSRFPESSRSLAHKVWRYQPITSNGNKRSVLNYSSGMSNNACRLLFRVGETHWIIQGERILFPRRGGAGVQMFVRVLSRCRSPLSFLSWPWLSLRRQHGWHRRWRGLVFFPYLWASSAQREEGVGRTTGRWLLPV